MNRVPRRDLLGPWQLSCNRVRSSLPPGAARVSCATKQATVSLVARNNPSIILGLPPLFPCSGSRAEPRCQPSTSSSGGSRGEASFRHIQDHVLTVVGLTKGSNLCPAVRWNRSCDPRGCPHLHGSLPCGPSSVWPRPRAHRRTSCESSAGQSFINGDTILRLTAVTVTIFLSKKRVTGGGITRTWMPGGGDPGATLQSVPDKRLFKR